MMKKTWKVLIRGMSLTLICAVPTGVMAQKAAPAKEDVTGPTVLRYSNVVYSPSRGALKGANIRLVREDGTLTGTFTLFDGSDTGRDYTLRGTMSGGRINFTVHAGDKTLRFRGHITDGSLVGTLTTTRPDGTKEESEFKARRLYGS